MTVQMRIPPGEGDRWYNPNRDLAHNFATVVKIVAGRLEDKRWPELQAVLAAKNVDDEQLGRAIKALCTFMASSLDDPKETMNDVLIRSGYFDPSITPETRIALMAHLGAVVSGMFFAGVREATIAGKGPLNTMEDMRAAGEEAARVMAIPRWRRRIRQFQLWFRNLTKALLGR
jgi:hypothetical protein